MTNKILPYKFLAQKDQKLLINDNEITRINFVFFFVDK